MTAAPTSKPVPDLRPLPPSVAHLNDARRHWRIWYDDLVDFVMGNPGATITEAAQYVGRSYAHVSLIMRSDMFKAKLSLRRQEREAHIDGAIREKLAGNALLSLDIIQQKLREARTNLPLKDVLPIAQTALDKLGYGAPAPSAPPGVAVNVNVGASSEALAAARAAMRQVEAARGAEPRPSGPGIAGPSGVVATGPVIDVEV